MNKLGVAGLILFYIILLIVSFMPLLALPIGGILFFVFAALMYFIPASSVFFWVWGLIYVLGGRQDAFAIIYYVCFAIVFMPVFLDASVRLYEKYFK